MGWSTKSNGDLLSLAEHTGFDILVTADQSLPFQNNLSDRRIAIVSLGTNHWNTIKTHPEAVHRACEDAQPGTYARVSFPKPRRHRRPPGPEP